MSQYTPPYDLVLVHDNCPDGRTAAWAYWSTLPEALRADLAALQGGVLRERLDSEEDEAAGTPTGTGTTLMGAAAALESGSPVAFAFVAPQTPVPDTLAAGRRVLVLDLDLGAALLPLARAAKSLRVIDHHASSTPTLEACRAELPDPARFSTRFDTDRSESGASLAFREFYPSNSSAPSPLPLVLQLVQIGDTWTWDSLDGSREAVEALHFHGHLRSVPSIHRAVAEVTDLAALVSVGTVLLKYQQNLVRGMSKNFEVAYVVVEASAGSPGAAAGLGQRCWMRALVAPCTVFASETGNALREWQAAKVEREVGPVHFCAVWNLRGSSMTVSLRGPAHNTNLSHVAPAIQGPGKVGGGGHPLAAGFSISDGLANFRSVFLASPPENLPEFKF